MQTSLLDAMVLAVVIALSDGVMAQGVYKCGDNTYSQIPCPGGVAIDADARTPAQKAQADQASARDARSAADMEKSRLAQEKMDLAANMPAVSASKPQASSAKKKKKKEPDDLVAFSKAKKKAPKKSTAKTNAGKT